MTSFCRSRLRKSSRVHRRESAYIFRSSIPWELGETYYFYVDSISLLKRGGGTVSIKLAPSCIIAVNWITGQLHWIGYEQKLGSFAHPDVYDRAVLIPPEKRQDIENAIFRNYYYGACAKRANALAALVPNSYYLPSDQEREDTKDAAKMDAQQMLSSYPLPAARRSCGL